MTTNVAPARDGQVHANPLADGPMHWRQIAAVAVASALNALDGFDVQAISFAAPGVAEQFGVDQLELGVILSFELFGMAIGSILLGNVADRIGRRPTIFGCLIAMGLGMALVPLSEAIWHIAILRVFTGLGVGGMLAATNAIVSEVTNDRRRSLCIAILVVGYPMGAILGGSLSARLLELGDWRLVFLVGAAAAAILLPLTAAFVPESIGYIAHRGGVGAVARVNAILERFGKPATAGLAMEDNAPPGRMRDLFSPALRWITVLLALGYFTHIISFYFILKWFPKIIVDMGFTQPEAVGVLVWANVGGACGVIALGLLSSYLNIRTLTLATLLGSTLSLALFGQSAANLPTLTLLAALAGFFTNAAIGGFYSLFGHNFPVSSRAGGTGFAIGIGRGGAIISPILAGALFLENVDLSVVAVVMGTGSLIAMVAVIALRSGR